MAKEIERKFLVNDAVFSVLEKAENQYCQQAYLCSDDEKVIRVRLLRDKAFLTIKSKVIGITRNEFEYEIPFNEAQQMIELFGEQTIAKKRYYIPYGQHTWEVDVFMGENEGLIIAEVELSDEQETVELPEWVDKEVTGDKKYYNANLQQYPFTEWS